MKRKKVIKKEFEHNNYTIKYQKYGRGDKSLLCFHGFGQSSEYYSFLEKELGHKYSIYSFDFFYHGDTPPPAMDIASSFDKNAWRDIIEAFSEEQNIKSFSIIGYSMGARLALALLEKTPEHITKVVLFAPDGIKDSFWYRFSTSNYFGRKFFKIFTAKPKPFLLTLDIIIKLGLLPKKIKKFVYLNTSSDMKRQQVYDTWMFLKKTRIDLEIVKQNIKENSIELNIAVGKYDKVILESQIRSWAWTRENIDKLHIMDCGHNIPSTKLTELIHKGTIL